MKQLLTTSMLPDTRLFGGAHGKPVHGWGVMRRTAALVAILLSTGCAAELDAAEAESTQENESGLGNSTYAQTQYPIVLCHGMSGFGSLFGVADYFHGVVSTLRDQGAEVYVTAVPPFNSTEARGEALLAQVEDIVARTGHAKVNLIGHSQGGLESRYVAAVRPDLVASVTAIASPHQGAELADFLRSNLSEGGFGEAVLSLFANSLGVVLGLLSGHTSPQDSIAAMESVTSAAAASFNERYPAGLPSRPCGSGPSEQNGIRFYSWSGTRQLTNVLDPSDVPLWLAARVCSEPSDGIVGRCSSHLGEVIRDDFRMNHVDEANHVAGLSSVFGTNPKSVYRAQANRLKNAGL